MSNEPLAEWFTVLCVVTPAGTMGYALDHDGCKQFMDKWRATLTADELAAHERIHTYGGVVSIRMLKADFAKITRLPSGGASK